MRALDLFCGAGGATKGLQRAGFHVTGVDIKPQPRYCGDVFIQGDATNPPVDLRTFDFIWASPPCQAYCAMKTMTNARAHPELIEPVRLLLTASGKPWVIENVFGAPLLNAIMLCGSMFSLESEGFQVRRHRYFETSFRASRHASCQHKPRTMGIYGAKVRDIAQEKRHYAKPKATRGQPIGVVLPQRLGFAGMQIDWMNIGELSESIPPAYSEFIARQFLAQRKTA